MSDIDPETGRRTATDRRPHFRMTTGYFTHPGKFAEIADPIERALTKHVHAAAIDWSRVHGTDGHVVLEDLCDELELPLQYGKNLIAMGMLHQADHDCRRCPQPRIGHVYVHDALEHNHSAAQERRILEKRRAGGNAASAARWAGHTPVIKEKRPPGRPRKNPPPAAAAFPDGPATLPGLEPAMHPAEARAREESGKKRGPGRPRRTEPKVYEPIVHQLCDELAQMVRNNGFSVGKIGEAWLVPCEQLLRIGPPNADEGVTPDQIRKAIQWANEDGFWWEQIRSMKNLREKYEQLRAAAKNPNRPKRGKLGVVRQTGGVRPPAAVSFPNMGEILARQLASGQGGMIKGENR